MKVYYIILLVLFSCKSVNSQTEKAEEVYLSHLKTIESFVKIENDSIDGNSLDEAIIFLETITSIKSSTTQNYDPKKFPTQQNLNDWQLWYSKNKQLLYWDDIETKVKVKKK